MAKKTEESYGSSISHWLDDKKSSLSQLAYHSLKKLKARIEPAELTHEQELLLSRAFLKIPHYAPYAKFFEQKGGKDNLPEYCKKELNVHLTARLTLFRQDHIPWLDKIRSLDGANVLEIGAGTGSSSVVLAEKGAIVDAIDNEAAPLKMAKVRAQVYGLDKITTHVCDATEIEKFDKQYDFIIFFASFEHLTYRERLSSLTQAWSMLSSGGCLVIIECPNRLWYYDQHTSLENFYNWIPDKLAIKYSKFCAREGFKEAFIEEDAEKSITRLARWGRGASYHELEIVLGPLADLDIRESLTDFKRSREEDTELHWNNSDPAKYRDTMMYLAPEVPGQFFYPWLDLVIVKP